MFLLSGVYDIKIYVKNVKAAYPLYTLLAQILMLKSLLYECNKTDKANNYTDCDIYSWQYKTKTSSDWYLGIHLNNKHL